MSRQTLAQAIRLRFGTSSTEPSDRQLTQIIDIIRGITRSRIPTNADWQDAVQAICPSFGKNIYASIDRSDLNDLLKEILDQAQ